jgi:rhodanese-related sulfurtransferase
MPIDLETVKPYLLPAAAAAFLLYRYFRFKAVKSALPRLAAAGAIFMDVRTRAEFAAGSRPGTINIPLDELQARAGELDKTKPIVLCCASGARSAVATGMLKKLGFVSVSNAGPWRNTL